MEDEGISAKKRGQVVEGEAGGGVKNVGVQVYERRKNRRRNDGVGDSKLKRGQGNGGLGEENGSFGGGRVEEECQEHCKCFGARKAEDK